MTTFKNFEERCEHGFLPSMQLCQDPSCFGEAARDLQKVKEQRRFRCRECGARRFRKELGESLTCKGGCD